jgi:hypothetical protein
LLHLELGQLRSLVDAMLRDCHGMTVQVRSVWRVLPGDGTEITVQPHPDTLACHGCEDARSQAAHMLRGQSAACDERALPMARKLPELTGEEVQLVGKERPQNRPGIQPNGNVGETCGNRG